jgi:hypothetical protein
MKTNTNTSFSPMRGIAPLIIILAIVVLGGGVFAVVNRSILKTYFETGDVPTQEQFGDTIDSSVHMQDDGIKTDASDYESVHVLIRQAEGPSLVDGEIFHDVITHKTMHALVLVRTRALQGLQGKEYQSIEVHGRALETGEDSADRFLDTIGVR